MNSLRPHDLKGRRIGLQLYGTEPNRPLVEFLEQAGASLLTVSPYVYADAADDHAVLNLLKRLEAKEIDAIAFTSTPQVERIFSIAPAETVTKALANTVVAAVGPVVADTLRKGESSARDARGVLLPEATHDRARRGTRPLTSVVARGYTVEYSFTDS